VPKGRDWHVGELFHETMVNCLLICPRNNGISENRIYIMYKIQNLFLRKLVYSMKPVCSIIKRKVFHFIQVYVQFVYFQMNNLGFSCLL
jgi:hypothetical protein